MKRNRVPGIFSTICGVMVLVLAASVPRSEAADGGAAAVVRVMSWNIESDSFVRDPAAFRALVSRAKADILLLDEVAPSTTELQLRDALPSQGEHKWHVDTGLSGGRQRGVIVSRWPLERVPELANMVPYPETERGRLSERMLAENELKPHFAMDVGIPVNGAIILVGKRRLLVVAIDLQCCGNDPASWQEDRRGVEVREIRRRIRLVLGRTRVDGIVMAGDFNLVSTVMPLVHSSGPYPAPHSGLIAAELYHRNGLDTWTWDGRGTRFTSTLMDVQLYSPHTLELREGYVLDTANLSPTERGQLKIEPDRAYKLSKHLPLVTEFVWR